MIIMPNQYPTPSPDLLFKIFRKIGQIAKKVWNRITGKDRVQEEISQKKGFNLEKSEASDIAELNRLLNEYRSNIATAAGDLEREMIVEYSMQMQEIMDLFEEYNKTLKIIRSETVKRRFNRMSREIKGTFAEYISKKISLDDAECVKVLKLPAGELKNQRLQEMKQKVFIEAGNDIITKIKNAVDDFSETVEDAFYEHLDRAEQSVTEKNNALEKLAKNSEENSSLSESVLFQADYIISVCSYADTLL